MIEQANEFLNQLTTQAPLFVKVVILILALRGLFR